MSLSIPSNVGTVSTFAAFNVDVGGLLCPSDGAPLKAGPYSNQGNTNYCFSHGDDVNCGSRGQRNPRGIFGGESFVAIRDIKDGTSNTIAMSEMVVTRIGQPSPGTSIHGNYVRGLGNNLRDNPAANCLIYKGPGNSIVSTVSAAQRGSIRGVVWAWGCMATSGFTTVLPPNSIGCKNNNNEWGNDAIFPPDSYHPGGVNALMADGSGQFIANTIDTGDLTAEAVRNSSVPGVSLASPSPYGVWGATGSKHGGETVSGAF